jgi:hypothetical protein
MNIDDYLIDTANLDWPRLLSGWALLVPPEVEVWLMNRFGDLFLVLPDGTVHMLDVANGRLDELAGSRDEFCRKVDEDGNANLWFMIPLADQLVEAGMTLTAGRCYFFLTPPILGGEYSVGNTRVVPIEELFGVYGSYHEQLRDLPDGAKVVLKVVD